MRYRLLAHGPEALEDYELLEMLLFMALPRRDTKPLAKTLLAHFGSLPAAISAPRENLLAVPGLGDAGVAALMLVRAAALRLIRADAVSRPVLNNWDRLMDYLNAVMAREKTEQVRILFLDNRNQLIADETQGHGTVNHTPVYPREIIKRALELHATALIIVHNHPSGDPTPSAEDIRMTRDLREAGRLLSVDLHDHVIVGRRGWVSFRKQGLL